MTFKQALTCVTLLTASVSACGGPKPISTGDSASLLNEISSRGASSVLRELWGKPEWLKLTTKVASGQKEWIDVALALAKASDSGATEELRDSLFEGLGRNARYILEALPTSESVEHSLAIRGVCSGRSDPLETYADAIGELKRAQAAVEAVSDVQLKEKRSLCLKELAAAEMGLNHFFDPKQ